MVKLGGGNYLKADECKEGDRIKFIDEGRWEENTRYKYEDGNPKVDFLMTVEHDGEKKTMRMNKMNRDKLSELWGSETKEWIGSLARIHLENCLVGGKKCKMIELEPMDAGSKEFKPGPDPSINNKQAWDE